MEIQDNPKLYRIRHSLAHVLAQAVQEVNPKARLDRSQVQRRSGGRFGGEIRCEAEACPRDEDGGIHGELSDVPARCGARAPHASGRRSPRGASRAPGK